MRVVYVYQGGRDQALEGEVLALFPGARTLAATPGMQGMTEVTLEFPGGAVPDAVDRLRAMPRIVDAAPGSLGEGA